MDERRTVFVEFYSVPRRRAGADVCAVPLSEAGTFGLLLGVLEHRFPEFGRDCLDNGRLHATCLASIDGRAPLDDPDQPLRAGDRVLIFSADAGG